MLTVETTMQTSKPRHTPGPWTPAVYRVTETMRERLALGSVHHAVALNDEAANAKGLLIAICGDEPGLDSQSAADARLIALAPELYDAVWRVACDLVITNRPHDEERKVLNNLWQICRKLVERYDGFI